MASCTLGWLWMIYKECGGERERVGGRGDVKEKQK